MKMDKTKLMVLGLVVVGVVVGMYIWQNKSSLTVDESENASTSTYPIPMGATNAPDPSVLERMSRAKIDALIKEVKQGQTSDKVFELQTELQKLGYIVKSWKPTKFYGTVTASAVAKYQASKK